MISILILISMSINSNLLTAHNHAYSWNLVNQIILITAICLEGGYVEVQFDNPKIRKAMKVIAYLSFMAFLIFNLVEIILFSTDV